jgi:hypothetical protein
LKNQFLSIGCALLVSSCFYARSEIFYVATVLHEILPRSLFSVLVRILGGVLSDFSLSAWSWSGFPDFVFTRCLYF